MILNSSEAMKNLAPGLLLVTGLLPAAAAASSITYQQSLGTPYQAPAITRLSTLGDQMAGMDVWVDSPDGSVQHGTWATTGSGSGAASVAGYFSISETGDTWWDDAWVLQNLNDSLAITGFKLFGPGGNTVFDRTFGEVTGTAGSGLGLDFNVPGNYIATATYTDMLNLTGQPAVDDEFLTLQVDLDSSTPIVAGSWTLFSQDTDNATVGRTRNADPVPEGGSTAALLGFGCLCLGRLRRRIG